MSRLGEKCQFAGTRHAVSLQKITHFEHAPIFIIKFGVFGALAVNVVFQFSIVQRPTPDAAAKHLSTGFQYHQGAKANQIAVLR